ncbi:MAG: tetratricopeptide repeat protein [Candidatus Eisenbacteria bacterium]|nr:tetratricopeptide repeat protein [Candidatus Latescibacterota bacterium]MBD3301543.1 tetratricopeptide repeat protein [Candidatus Eisenbacteria bacterium]
MAVFPRSPWGAMPSEEHNLKRIEDLERRLRSREGDRDLLLQLVRLYLEAGRPKNAAALLESRLLAGESGWEIVWHCAESFRRAGDPERGLEVLAAHESENADRAAFWSLRGRMYEDLGNLDTARRDHQRAVQIDPEDPELRYRLGVTLMKAGRDEEAIDSFETCVSEDPRMVKAQINIGCILDAAGARERAVLAFQKAIEMNPASVESHCNLGAAYGDLGRRREAVEEFQRAIEIDPGCALAHFNLGVIHLEEKPEEARVSLQRAMALEPENNDIRYYLGVLYFKKGMYETAVRHLHVCLEREPDSPRILYVLGMALNKSDLPDAAIETLTRLCELEPKNADAHFNLGIALDKKGLYDQAKAAYRQADRLMQG